MDNQAHIPQAQVLDSEPYLKQLIYVLTTDTHLHNRGAWEFLKFSFMYIVIGAALGYIIFGSPCTGATLGYFLALMFGDETSMEVFTLVEDLQYVPVEKHRDIERTVEELLQSDSLVALRDYVKVPNQCSQLMKLLKSNFEKRPRDYSSVYIFSFIFVVLVLMPMFSTSGEFTSREEF